MKKTLLITLSVVAALSMVSCKNNKKNRNQEPTQEEIQAQKQALADSVLAKIDALTKEYLDARGNSFAIKGFKLTESEKLVKPDYLLDPSQAPKFVTKLQKLNALAVYLIEMHIRNLYDMPLDEANEAIARLASDIYYPLNLDMLHSADVHPSEIIKAEYDKCKENGELALFWEFQNATTTEIVFILHQNPDLFLNKITDDQWNSFLKYSEENEAAIQMLAEYDEEMAAINNTMNKFLDPASRPIIGVATLEHAKQVFAADKEFSSALRNALLQ